MNTLGDIGLFTGAKLFEFDRLSSTNDKAIELIKQSNVTEGSVVLTHDQFQGKGQFGKAWESEPRQNLTASIILFPKFVKASDQFVFHQIASLSVCKALQTWGLYSRIKWPNDIYVKDSKLGGILIEASILGTKMQYAVIGIGLNVNQASFGKNLPNPVSMKVLANKEFDIIEILEAIRAQIASRYLMFQSQGRMKIHQDYIERMYKIGEKSSFELKATTESFNAIIHGVDDLGRLKLETDTGMKYYGMDEIKISLPQL